MFSNIFYLHPYLGKWSNLTNIFQMGGSTTNQMTLWDIWDASLRKLSRWLWQWQTCFRLESGFKEVSYHFQLDVSLRQRYFFFRLGTTKALLNLICSWMTLFGVRFLQKSFCETPFLSDPVCSFLHKFSKAKGSRLFPSRIRLASPTNVSWFGANYMEGNHRIHVRRNTHWMCEDFNISYWLLSRFFRYVEILNKYIYHLWPKAWLATPSQAHGRSWMWHPRSFFVAAWQPAMRNWGAASETQWNCGGHDTKEATKYRQPQLDFCLGKIWLESWLRTMGKRMMLN